MQNLTSENLVNSWFYFNIQSKVLNFELEKFAVKIWLKVCD